MNSVATALFALALAAVTPAALAEDRASDAGDRGQTGGQPRQTDLSSAAQADNTNAQGSAGSQRECRELSATGDCQAGATRRYRLIRDIDWTSVGPSADDFAVPEDNLRLVGARLVGIYKF